MKTILIFGVTSAIAEVLAKRYASEGHKLVLFARNTEKMTLIERDLKVRGASEVICNEFDAAATDNVATLTQQLQQVQEEIDICVIAHGSLPDQQECQQDVQKTLIELQVNGNSVISILTLIANRMEQQQKGDIAVITSVAGIRGRQSNYVYGAAKGLVSVFLQGLGQRLAKSGVHVLDIKPGFVDTPMTEHIAKGGPLWAKPQKVADIIYKRIAKRSHISSTPFFWFFIMTIIRFIPVSIFNKLKL